MSNRRIKPSYVSYLLIICFSLMVSSCSTLSKNSRLDSLDQSLSEFRKTLRWGYYDQAAKFIQIKNYKKSLRNTEYLKDIRITSYEYGEKSFSEDGTSADVVALINFYNVNQGTVSTLNEKQTWRRDADQKQWFLDGDLPDFTGRN